MLQAKLCVLALLTRGPPAACSVLHYSWPDCQTYRTRFSLLHPQQITTFQSVYLCFLLPLQAISSMLANYGQGGGGQYSGGLDFSGGSGNLRAQSAGSGYEGGLPPGSMAFPQVGTSLNWRQRTCNKAC